MGVGHIRERTRVGEGVDTIVIMNERAGTENPAVTPRAVRDAFVRAGADVAVDVQRPEGMPAALRAAARGGPRAIIVGGGDGSVRTAASILAGSDIALGVLPLGTLNHFAKDLGMPEALEPAVAALVAGEARWIDVGEINGEIFINNCSIGSYAEAVRRRDRLRAVQGLGKWRAMAQASWQVFRRLRRLRLRVTLDGAAPRLIRTPLVVVGNNRYTGHLLNRSLRERLDEGRLWFYAMHAHRRLAVARMIVASLFHRLDEVAHLETQAVQELVIEGLDGPLQVAADGELLDATGPLRFRIRPRALRVLFPARTGQAGASAVLGAGSRSETANPVAPEGRR